YATFEEAPGGHTPRDPEEATLWCCLSKFAVPAWSGAAGGMTLQPRLRAHRSPDRQLRVLRHSKCGLDGALTPFLRCHLMAGLSAVTCELPDAVHRPAPVERSD